MGIKPTVSVKGNFKNVKKVQNKLKVFEKTLPVKVGIFASAGNYDQTGVSLVEVAAINEFGSEKAHIPERSFLRQPLRNGGSELRKIAIRVVKAVLEEKMEFQPGMKILGEWGVKTCKNAITDGDGIAPSNAASTIARKGSSRPLFDTGHLLNSITYVIEGGAVEDTNSESGGGPESGGSDPLEGGE